MKKFLIISLMIPVLAFTQVPDTCFTKQEIQDISYTLDSLYKLADINDSIIEAQKKLIADQRRLIHLDELQLEYKTKQVALLNENIQLYVEREKHLKPKWYENKALWYGGGIISTILIFQVAK
jgi:ABC-type transport system involved in cytochrome bd biosynthesis fused ATPase/permease subunit